MGARVRDEAKAVMIWLVGEWRWPGACLFAACMMFLVTPVWLDVAGAAVTLILLQLPLYMVHEFEEHLGDRFRKYINQNVAHCEALTPAATFWINAVGVWGLELVAIYLAVFVDLRVGLVAFYLPLVNALTHIREAVVRREYNPGLWTSLVLFLPISGWGLYLVSVQSGATWIDQLLGAGAAVAVHVAIIVYIVARVRHLRATSSAA
jgi:hypothetical protein